MSAVMSGNSLLVVLQVLRSDESVVEMRKSYRRQEQLWPSRRFVSISILGIFALSRVRGSGAQTEGWEREVRDWEKMGTIEKMW